MSYAQISKTAGAKKFIEDRERALAAAAAIKRADTRIETSRLWLGEYLARPRRSSFGWGPRFPFTKPETIDGQVSENPPLLTFQQVGEAVERPQKEAAEVGHGKVLGDATGPSGSGGGIAFDTPF